MHLVIIFILVIFETAVFALPTLNIFLVMKHFHVIVTGMTCIFFLITTQSNAQSDSIEISYCIPESKTYPVQVYGDISLSVINLDISHQYQNDIIFIIKGAKGEVFNSGNIIITKDKPYPSGTVLKATFNNGSAKLDSTNILFGGHKELEEELIFIAHVDSGQIAYAGPVLFYQIKQKKIYSIPIIDSNGNQFTNVYIKSACAIADSAKNFREQYLYQLSLQVVDSLRYDSTLSQKLLDKHIVPNADALELLKFGYAKNAELYPGTAPNDSLSYIPLPPISNIEERKFARSFKKDNKTSRMQAREFTRLSHKFGSLLAENLNDLSDSAIKIYPKVALLQLKDWLKVALKSKHITSRATLKYLNSSIRVLNNLMAKNELQDFIAATSCIIIDLKSVIIPDNIYFTSVQSLPKMKNNWLSASLNPPESIPENLNEPFTDQNIKNSLRVFNFYIFEVQKKTIPRKVKIAPRMIDDTVVSVNEKYIIYCVPTGIYELYISKNKSLDALSEYRCKGLASICSKGLALVPYYFFAVSVSNQGMICNKRVIKYDTRDILKDTADTKTPLPYAYPIIINK